ncbi:hypothetical protein OCL06_07495 [Alteromonas sp. ASW11-19]|uniref:Uncharacterized protein n=1 Tax=Alteromonas salexigens TaxID=2982530 RepID=A0ABT2VNG7_9ALTE|nr:hypothetical protein [Alteromonas salexigens]MCU7554438.1 hypothetical protein [Alteromonas salexigens]
MLSKIIKKLKNKKRRVKCNPKFAIFHVDELSPYVFSGWAYIPRNASKEQCQVSLTVNNTPVCKTEANLMREDLVKSGVGDGQFGFTTEPNWQALEIGSNELVLWVNEVPVSIFKLQVSQKQMMVAMTQQIHRQIQLSTHELSEKLTALIK